MSRTRVVYLLHYHGKLGDPSRPGMWAQHYVGSFWTEDRIEHHRNGTSHVYIVRAFHARGIEFTVARMTKGGKELERRIKNYGHFKDFCPICTPEPKKGLWAPKPPPRRKRHAARTGGTRNTRNDNTRPGTQNPAGEHPPVPDGRLVPEQPRVARENDH